MNTTRLQQPWLGTRKLHDLLQQQPEPALQVARDRLFEILRCSWLLVVPKRAYHKTTNSHHRFYRHLNLLKYRENRDIGNQPELVWVADITYLPLRKRYGVCQSGDRRLVEKNNGILCA